MLILFYFFLVWSSPRFFILALPVYIGLYLQWFTIVVQEELSIRSKSKNSKWCLRYSVYFMTHLPTTCKRELFKTFIYWDVYEERFFRRLKNHFWTGAPGIIFIYGRVTILHCRDCLIKIYNKFIGIWQLYHGLNYCVGIKMPCRSKF